MARLDKIADLADRFVLVRRTNMRGVNLYVFEFDHDLTWAGFFMNADEKVYGRFGGRDATSPDAFNSLAALRYAMTRALAAHEREPRAQPSKEARAQRTVDHYAAAQRLRPTSCVHCHQAYDFPREQLQQAGTFRTHDVWVYPLPENVGLTLEGDQGDRVRAVVADSPASRLGLRPGDALRSVNDVPVASFADVQYALHRAPTQGAIGVTWERAGQVRTGKLALESGWRKTDLAWRASTRRVGPHPCVHGEDLTAEEKQQLGLPEKRLAFRQGSFLTPPARQAGLRQNDIILGLDGKALEMTGAQFQVYIRLNYKPGDRVTFDVLRGRERLQVPLTLPGQSPF